MCMYVNEGAKIRRTFRKIQCWKVVKWDSEHGIYTGPFYDGDCYVEGCTLKSDEKISPKYNAVFHGLHTYADKTEALDNICHFSEVLGGEYRLVMCEIPFFTRFVEGTGMGRERCYVSERLKVVKFV